MSTPTSQPASDGQFPTDKLNALRLGRELATEVPASGSGRRAFINIRPVRTPADDQATREGWKRPDRARTFRVQHWEYEADRIDGWDFDIGAVRVRATTVAGEPKLISTLEAWKLRPEQFLYPWQTDDPR